MILKFKRDICEDFYAIPEFLGYDFCKEFVINTKNIVTLEQYWKDLDDYDSENDISAYGIIVNGKPITIAITINDVVEDGSHCYSDEACEYVTNIYQQIVDAMENDI